MNNNDNKIMSCIGLGFLAILAIVGNSLMNGWVLRILWGWFMVPAFGLPSLSLVLAMGIGLVISFATHQTIPDPKDESTVDKWVRIISGAFFIPLFFLAMGWVIHIFM